jgi:hypothetical protein
MSNRIILGVLGDWGRDEFLLRGTEEEQRIIHNAEVKIQNRIEKISHHENAARLILEIKKLRKDFFARCTQKGSPSVNRNRRPSEAVQTPRREASSTASGKLLSTEQRIHGYEMHASMLFFDPESPQKHMKQKISVHDLSKDNNPIRKPCPEGKFRYFHLPRNNMKWVVVSQPCFISPLQPYLFEI